MKKKKKTSPMGVFLMKSLGWKGLTADQEGRLLNIMW